VKTITLFAPSQGDACAYYRGPGVFAYLDRLPGGHQFQASYAGREIGWPNLLGSSVFFMQRPYSEQHLEAAQLAKHQMPVWIDYDDALFDVPVGNPAWELYSLKKETAQNIANLISIADVLTFSTQGCKDSFLSRLDKISASFVEVIPNAYNDYVLPTATTSAPTNNHVFWRGSESHQKDLLTFSKSLSPIIRSSSIPFRFMGLMPWMLEPGLKFDFSPGIDLLKYLHAIQTTIRPAYQIVTLTDNTFNRAKSNIAWLETCMCGTRTLVPNLPEWHNLPNTVTYEDEYDFEQAFQDLIAPAAKSTYVPTNLFLSKINQARLDILKEIT